MDKHRKALPDWATRGVAVSDTLAATYRELLAWMERVRAETLAGGVDLDAAIERLSKPVQSAWCRVQSEDL